MSISTVGNGEHHGCARRLYPFICFSGALLMFAVFTVETLYQHKAARLDLRFHTASTTVLASFCDLNRDPYAADPVMRGYTLYSDYLNPGGALSSVRSSGGGVLRRPPSR